MVQQGRFTPAGGTERFGLDFDSWGMDGCQLKRIIFCLFMNSDTPGLQQLPLEIKELPITGKTCHILINAVC